MPAAHNIIDKLVNIDIAEMENCGGEMDHSDIGKSSDLTADFIAAIKLVRVADATVVSAVVINILNGADNIMRELPCAGGTAMAGYAHDRGRDTLLVKCVECMPLATLREAYQLSMPGVGPWRANVPLPSALVESMLRPPDKRRLKALREKYSAPRYSVELIQMRGC